VLVIHVISSPIGGVIVSVLATSAIDRGFEPHVESSQRL
jgi:hypothetical protein